MKGFALVSLALCVVLAAGAVWAHPPKEVKLEFDPAGKMLTVNGEKIIEQKFKSQVSADGQKAQYWINDAAVGDTLAVTATCNIAGKKKVTLEIAKPAEPAKTK
jgi:hypothetical protein